MKRHLVRQYERTAERFGCSVVDVSVTGGKHVKMTLRHGDRTRFFILPSSPSDHRFLLNYRRDVRRWVYRMGETVCFEPAST